MKIEIYLLVLLMSLGIISVGCADDDDDENEADEAGVGAQCEVSTDCTQPETDAGPMQECLTNFTGGYCGIKDCTGNADCPEGAACVAHEDNVNYCFRQCTDKSECNVNRDPEVESNCSANIEFVDADTLGKACVPPSSGK